MDRADSRDAIASKSITDIDGLSTSRIYFSQNEWLKNDMKMWKLKMTPGLEKP